MIPETRSEQYLASIIGEEVELPVPQSRIEHYLNIIAQNGVAPSSAGLINYDPDASYPDGSIGKEVHDLDGDVSELKSEIDELDDLIISSENLLDSAKNTANGYIDNTTGAVVPYANWTYSDYIPVVGGQVYEFISYDGSTWIANSAVYFAFYNSQKVFTHGGYTSSALKILTSQSGDAYVRVSASTAVMTTRSPMVGLKSDMDEILGETDAGLFIPYGNTLYADTLKQTVDEITSELSAIDFEIVLPDRVYIAVGRQITFYAPNFIKTSNPENYCYYWFSRLTNTTFDDSIRFEPTNDDIGEHSTQLFVMNKYNGEQLAVKSFKVEVVADATLTSKNVLFIGDSLTAYGFYPYEVERLSNSGITSIGTITSTGYYDPDSQTTVSVNTEGRGGWSAKEYVTEDEISSVANAFWNPSTSKFDFSYYMTNSGVATPDMVFVNLGTNGYGEIDDEIDALEEIVASIRTYSATVPIGIGIVPPSNKTEGDYTSIFFTILRQKQLETFDNRQNEYIYVAPIYLNLNRNTDFKTETVDESSRNPEQVTRQTDGPHPSKYGLWKFADVYYSVIQKALG